MCSSDLERRAGIDGHFHVLRGRDGGIGAGAVQKVIGQPTGSAASQQDQQHEPEQEARYQLRHTRKCAARSQLSYNSILFLEMQPLK